MSTEQQRLVWKYVAYKYGDGGDYTDIDSTEDEGHSSEKYKVVRKIDFNNYSALEGDGNAKIDNEIKPYDDDRDAMEDELQTYDSSGADIDNKFVPIEYSDGQSHRVSSEESLIMNNGNGVEMEDELNLFNCDDGYSDDGHDEEIPDEILLATKLDKVDTRGRSEQRNADKLSSWTRWELDCDVGFRLNSIGLATNPSKKVVLLQDRETEVSIEELGESPLHYNLQSASNPASRMTHPSASGGPTPERATRSESRDAYPKNSRAPLRRVLKSKGNFTHQTPLRRRRSRSREIVFAPTSVHETNVAELNIADILFRAISYEIITEVDQNGLSGNIQQTENISITKALPVSVFPPPNFRAAASPCPSLSLSYIPDDDPSLSPTHCSVSSPPPIRHGNASRFWWDPDNICDDKQSHQNEAQFYKTTMDKYSDADFKKRYAFRRYNLLTGLAIDAITSWEAFEEKEKEEKGMKGKEKGMEKIVRSDHIRYTSPIRRGNTHVVRAPNSPRRDWNPFNIGDDEYRHRNEGQYY
ncbi:hypothetical protein V500_10622 [Pseudogymnoascus sp. VKM F-4518 (FW-2643)]|nr:hypothetical protein V500_10622 [Pseudogymnoascus sp. VKM F-4518 (FW-2643)]